jgi:hypothetical protein
MCKYESIVNCYKEREITFCYFMLSLIWCLNDQFVTQKWQICCSSQLMFKNPTVNLNALCNSCVMMGCCSSELISAPIYAGSNIPKCEPAIRLLCPPFFCKLHSSTKPTNKSAAVRSVYSNSSNSVNIQKHTHVHTSFFSHCPILSPHKTLTFPPESPCISLLLTCTQFLNVHVVYIDTQNFLSAWKWIFRRERCRKVHWVLWHLNIY